MTQYLPQNLVEWAADLIDRSGLVPMLEGWEVEDAKYRGGRPTTLTFRAVLIAWLVVAYEQQPLFVLRVAEALTVRLSADAARVMGVPASFCLDRREVMVRRVERVMDRILDRVDYKPLPTHGRRLTRGELDDVHADRILRADELDEKRRRMFRFTNTLLHAQYDGLPAAARSDKLSLAMDATFMDAPSRGMSSARLSKRKHDETVPADPDAGWYVRSYDQRRGWDGTVDNALKKVGYGYEAELAILVSNDPYAPNSVPHIIVGFNFHSPSASAGRNAREMLEGVIEWGHGLGYIIADQAYLPGSNPDDLQSLLLEHGALPSMRYPLPTSKAARGEGTIQESANGAHMVEGTWMCPATPMTARQAALKYTEACTADDKNPLLSNAQKKERELEHRKLRYARIEERSKWELRVKERRDGKLIMACPAVGKDRSLDCPLKPNQPLPREGRVPLPVLSPPRAPGKICTNQSSTSFDAKLGLKYQQHLRYGSPEWEDVHTPGRQVIESFNWRLKHADNSLTDASHRMLRGEASQAFLALLGVVSANAHAIYNWVDEHHDASRPAPEPRTRLKRTDRHTVMKRTRGRGITAARLARLGIAPSSS